MFIFTQVLNVYWFPFDGFFCCHFECGVAFETIFHLTRIDVSWINFYLKLIFEMIQKIWLPTSCPLSFHSKEDYRNDSSPDNNRNDVNIIDYTTNEIHQSNIESPSPSPSSSFSVRNNPLVISETRPTISEMRPNDELTPQICLVVPPPSKLQVYIYIFSFITSHYLYVCVCVCTCEWFISRGLLLLIY